MAKIVILLAQNNLNRFQASKFVEFNSLPSTNNYAIENLKNGFLQHGDAIFTHDQTQGKGQMGKVWKSTAHQNVALTTIWDTKEMPISHQFHIIIIGALAGFDLFEKYCGDDTHIKWPNDIYWQDRKAGGILTESIIRQQNWQWTIIGTGLNINQTSFDNEMNRKPVSMKQITGKNFECRDLAKELIELQRKRWIEYQENGIAQLLETYNEKLYKKEQKINILYQNAEITATVKKVDENGLVYLQIANDIIAFSHGAFQWLNAKS